MKELTNQEKIRYTNQKTILDAIRYGSHSCSQLSKKTGLSGTSVETIVDELTQMGILKLSGQPSKSGRGRKPICYHLNADYGVVVSVDLSGRDMLICIANATRQILYRAEIKSVLQITTEVLEAIAEKIKLGLESDRVKGKPLLCICIASPGKIEKETGRFIQAPRIENYRQVNLHTFFQEKFGCEVLVKRDVQCGLIGETQFGVLSDDRCKNAVFLHFDISVSAAFMLGGEVYGGEKGSSGEIGFIIPEISRPNLGMDDYLSLTAIYTQIKKKIKKLPYRHALADKYVLEFDEVKLLFLSGDEAVDEVLLTSAKYLAIQLLNFANLFDVWQIVLDGRLIELGDKFLRYVDGYIQEFNRSTERLHVRYSGLMNKAITLGCVHAAVQAQFEKTLLSRVSNQ